MISCSGPSQPASAWHWLPPRSALLWCGDAWLISETLWLTPRCWGLRWVFCSMSISISPYLTLAVFIALVLMLLQSRRLLATDTLLGILAHSTLSVGLVVMAFQDSVRVDLIGYLFGDILAVSADDLWWVWGGGLLVLAALAAIWRPLLALTVHEELAQVEGVPVSFIRLAFMLMIAIVIAISMKIVGVLLITSMMIIPAAAARRFSHTPEQMALVAALIGVLAVCMGLAASWYWDTPAGPSVVVSAALLFSFSQLSSSPR